MPHDLEVKGPPLAALGGALQGGIAGGVIWFVVNNAFRIDRQGWLERLEGPAPGWLVFAGAGAVVGAVMGYVKHVGERRRSDGLAASAAELGLDHADEVGRNEIGAAGMPALADWSRGRNHHHGLVEGIPIDVVDATLVSESTDSEGGTSRKTTERTVVLLPAEGVPDLDLSAAGRGMRLLHRLGIAGMAFDASAMATGDATEAVERFDRSWIVAPGAEPMAEDDDPSSREAAVRRLFPTRVMDQLEPHAGCSAQFRGGRLAVWRGNGFRSAEQRRGLVADALALRRILVEAAARPAADGEVVPAPAGETATRRARRGLGAIAGGVLGLMLGFFGGAIGFAGIFFGADPPFASTAVLMPLMVLGGAALGAVAGALIGMAAHRLMPIPEGVSIASLTHGPRRRRPTRRAGLAEGLGMFLGFGLGGMVGGGAVMGLVQVFGPRDAPVWLILPVFFGCPIAGAVLGSIAAGRWASRREE